MSLLLDNAMKKFILRIKKKLKHRAEYESAEDTEDLLQEGKEKNVTFDITLPSAHSVNSF